MLGSLALLLKLAIVFPNLTFKRLICLQNILLMNSTLGFTIYPGPNAVMTAELFSNKSRFIYYFRIAHY